MEKKFVNWTEIWSQSNIVCSSHLLASMQNSVFLKIFYGRATDIFNRTSVKQNSNNSRQCKKCNNKKIRAKVITLFLSICFFLKCHWDMTVISLRSLRVKFIVININSARIHIPTFWLPLTKTTRRYSKKSFWDTPLFHPDLGLLTLRAS